MRWWLAEGGDDLNPADNVRIQRFQVLCRNPVLLMLLGARHLHRVALEKARPNLEARRIPDRAVFRIPIARDAVVL